MSQNLSRFDPSDNGISVVELDGGGEAIFAGLLGAYGERGYDSGYRRAVADVRALLLLLMKDYLREQTNPAEIQQALLGFENYFDQHLHLMRRGGDYVSDGLGI